MSAKPTPPGGTDVRALIREQMANAESFTTQQIVDRVLTLLSPDGRAQALRIALPSLVRDVAHGTRPHRDSNRPASTPVSAKVAARRSWWEQQIEAIYSAGVVMKRLGDFTADELAGLTATAHEMAASNAAAAARFEKLLAAMGEQGAERVRDLDGEILQDILESGEAA